MQIHVISAGQSLYGIAEAYGTTVQSIVDANQIPDPNRLVVGQALVIPIPGMYYWVEPGDSWYLIEMKFGIPYQQLALVNQVSVEQPLSIGQRIYIPPKSKTSVEVNAYVEPFGEDVSESLAQSVKETAPNLTYLAPFNFEIQRDGSLQEPPLNGLINLANQNNVTLMMVVTNIEDGVFSDELGSLVLNDMNVQNRLLDTIIETANRLGFRVIQFDMEFLKGEERERYNDFLRKAAERIKAKGWSISTALAPKTSAEQSGQWYEAHDYAAHGEIVDFVVLMTYEWGYSGGPPLPVSPIGPVRDVVQYALTEIPASKIMLGQNLYGYDWKLPYIEGGPYARALSPQQAIQLAADKNAAIFYDYQAQAPFFNYVDDEGNRHEVWFEDARSIQAKFNLIKELGLRGISYWKLGLSFPQNWLLLIDNFNVVHLTDQSG